MDALSIAAANGMRARMESQPRGEPLRSGVGLLCDRKRLGQQARESAGCIERAVLTGDLAGAFGRCAAFETGPCSKF